MRHKTIDKHFRFTPEEAAELKAKAEAVGLSETALIRMLIKGCQPREQPDERFFEINRELSAIGNNINQLAAKANSRGFIDGPWLMAEAKRWAEFQKAVTERFLLPEKDERLQWP